MADIHSDLRAEIEELRSQIRDAKEQALEAKHEASMTREEVLRLRDIIAAAQRDQQDLRTARAYLIRLRMRGLFARILNRP